MKCEKLKMNWDGNALFRTVTFVTDTRQSRKRALLIVGDVGREASTPVGRYKYSSHPCDTLADLFNDKSHKGWSCARMTSIEQN